MAYVLTPKKNHVSSGLDKVLQQFKGKPVLASILGSALAQIQKLEDATWEVILIRGIAQSSGVGLDAIGVIVGRARMGLSDVNYRVALRAEIRINRSSGTPTDLIDVTALSLPPGFVFSYDESYPATVLITVENQVDSFIQVLFDNLVHTKMGGVRLFLQYWDTVSIDRSFRFSMDPINSTTSATHGFGFDGSPDGGILAAVAVG